MNEHEETVAVVSKSVLADVTKRPDLSGNFIDKLRENAVQHIIVTFVPFAVGIFINEMLNIFGDVTPVYKLSILTLGVISCLAIILAFALNVTVKYTKSIDSYIKAYEHNVAAAYRRDRFLVSMNQDEPKSAANKLSSSAYNFCSLCASKAQSRILIVSPHFPDRLDITPATDSHSRYLTDGLITALQRHAFSGSSKILDYVRIVQLEPDDHLQIDVDGRAPRSIFRDRALREHLEEVLRLRRDYSHRLRINIYGREFVPSFPSVLVIDDDHVFFSLPTNLTSSIEEASSTPSRLSDLQPSYDFVLGISDKERETADAFRSIVLQFAHGSREIKELRD